MKELTSTHNLKTIDSDQEYLFLAGSMSSTTTDDWRKKCIHALSDDYHFLNPTHSKYSRLSDSEMKQHITWELNALERADVILVNLLSKAISPISMAELGLYMTSDKLMVVCPNEFHASRYVNFLCSRYNTPIFKNLNQAITQLRNTKQTVKI